MSGVMLNSVVPPHDSDVEMLMSCEEDRKEVVQTEEVVQSPKLSKRCECPRVEPIMRVRVGKIVIKMVCNVLKLADEMQVARGLGLARTVVTYSLAVYDVATGKCCPLSDKFVKKVAKVWNKAQKGERSVEFDKKQRILIFHVKDGSTLVTAHYALWGVKELACGAGIKGKKMVAATVVKQARLYLTPLYMLSQVFIWLKYGRDCCFIGYWVNRNAKVDKSDFVTNVALLFIYGIPIILFGLKRVRSLLSICSTTRSVRRLCTDWKSLDRNTLLKHVTIVAKAPLKVLSFTCASLSWFAFACRTKLQTCCKKTEKCATIAIVNRVTAVAQGCLQLTRKWLHICK